MNKTIATSLKIGISIAIITYLVYKAGAFESGENNEFTKLWHSPKNWGFLIAAQVLVVLAIAVSFWRWMGLVHAVKLKLSLFDAMRIGFIGHMFGVFSIGTFGADAVRVFYVARDNPKQKTLAFLTVFVDRLSGLMGLFSLTTITIIGLQFVGESAVISTEEGVLKNITRIVVISTFVGLSGYFCNLFVLPYFAKQNWVKKLTELKLVGGIIKHTIDAGLAYQSHPFILIFAFCQSLLVHILLTLTVFCVAIGLSGTHPTIGDHFIISPIAHLPGILPLPGGIGGLELAMDYFYKATLSNDSSYGLMVAFGYRLTAIIAAGLGVYFYIRGRKELSQMDDFGVNQDLGKARESEKVAESIEV